MKTLLKYWPFVAVLLCLFLAQSANGIMDALAFHNAGEAFGNKAFWGSPAQTWTNKWALGEDGRVLVGVERFWGSSRWLVSLTDGWHLAKFCQLFFFKLAVLFAIPAGCCYYFYIRFKWWHPVAAFVGISLAMSAGFHLTYTLIF